jgi:hypothetical protein
MSGVQRSRKGLTSKQQFCRKKESGSFESKEAAKARIKSLEAKGMRGTARLHVYKCPKCSRRSKEVFHVGHRRPQ